LVLIIVLAAACIGSWLSVMSDREQTREVPIRPSATAKVETGEPVVVPPPKPLVNVQPTASRSSENSGGLVPPSPPDPVRAWVIGFVATVILVYAAIFAWARARTLISQLPRIESVVKDTPEFDVALRIWHPWVVFDNNTPRSVKRFKNRVRYLAGVQKTERAPRNLLERFAAPLWRWAGGQSSSGVLIEDPLLVGLAAIHHSKYGTLENADQLHNWAAVTDAASKTPGAESLVKSMTLFEEFFPEQWPPTPEQLAVFNEMIGSVRT
jgi:hypothetical protein